MTPLDLLDQSFLRRRPADRVRMPAAVGAAHDAAARGMAVARPLGSAPGSSAPAICQPAPPDEPSERAWQVEDGDRPDAAGPPDDPFLMSLLDDAPLAWRQLADCVAAAHGRGRRSIAVAGSRHGEGRSTLVRGVAHLLRERGLEVECVGLPDLGDWRDDTLTLVDAGVWFPPGPLRRQTLERRSIGCDAVIIVRRADQPPCPAKAAAVEAVGLELLGEVVTFAPAGQSLH